MPVNLIGFLCYIHNCDIGYGLWRGDFVYTVEHYKQQSTGIFVLAEKEKLTVPGIELNAEENGFDTIISHHPLVFKGQKELKPLILLKGNLFP